MAKTSSQTKKENPQPKDNTENNVQQVTSKPDYPWLDEAIKQVLSRLNLYSKDSHQALMNAIQPNHPHNIFALSPQDYTKGFNHLLYHPILSTSFTLNFGPLTLCRYHDLTFHLPLAITTHYLNLFKSEG